MISGQFCTLLRCFNSKWYKVDVENNLGINVVSPGNRKFDLLSSDPLFFLPCDDHARLVSQKWYKNIKKLVRHLMEVINTLDEYKERKELISVRLIYVWICENIRYDPAFQEHQVKQSEKHIFNEVAFSADHD